MGDGELVDRGGGWRAGSDNWEGATDGQPEFLYSSVWVGLLVQVVRPFPSHFLFLLSYVTREGEVKAGICAIGPWCWDFFVREV